MSADPANSAGVRATRGGVTRQGVVLTDLSVTS